MADKDKDIDRVEPEPEWISVERWRIHTLIEAGYPNEEALVLAGRDDVDLHRAVKLLESGCSVALALKILT